MTESTDALIFECRACKIHLSFHQVIVIRGTKADLFRCDACGLCEFPEAPWLADAYSDPIASIDVGLLSRCITMANVAEAVIRAQGLGGRTHLDFGGGYGLLTRLLRDRGVDMRHFDPLAENLFAQGHEGEPSSDYSCATLIEVFEHLEDPVGVLQTIAHCDVIIISTTLVPTRMTDLTSWWYLIPELGQHITFYTQAALRIMAEKFDYTLTSDGVSLHVLHRRPLAPLARLSIRYPRAAVAPARALRNRKARQALLASDIRHAQALTHTLSLEEQAPPN